MTTSRDSRLSRRCPAGVFTLDDALAVGFSDSGIRNRLARGVWRELTRGVYVATTMPLQVCQWERAAVLAYPGRSVLSHFSAARAWGIPVAGPDIDQGETTRAWFTVEAGARWRLPPEVRAVRTRHMPVAWTRGGLLVTSPARTVVDLAMCCGRSSLRDALAHVLDRRLCLIGHVVAETNRLSRRKGHTCLRQVLAEFRPEYESFLELTVGGGLRRRGVDGFVPQYAVRDVDGVVIARLDFADPERRLGVETDGWAYHGSRLQQQGDKRRDRRLAREGWLVLRFTTEEILADVDRVVDEIMAVRDRRPRAA